MNAGIKPAVWIPNISLEQLSDSKIIDKTGLKTGLGELNASEVQTTENGGSQGVLIYPNTPEGNNILQRVQNEGATDTVLAEVLGFVETQTPDHNNVITVKDAAGNIIERQTVSDKNITKAVSSAKKRYRNNPEFTIQQQTKEEALADRDLKVRKVEEESAGPHLKALARISRLLKDKYIREMLKKVQSEKEIIKIINNEDLKKR